MKFRFVDNIIRVKDGEYIEGIKAVSAEEYFLLNRFGLRSQFPQTLMAEALFQLSNFLIYKTFKSRLALLTLFKRIEVRRPLGPGEILFMKIRIDSIIEESVRLSGAGYVGEEEVIAGSGCVGVLVDIETLYDPDDYDRLFCSLCRKDLPHGGGVL